MLTGRPGSGGDMEDQAPSPSALETAMLTEVDNVLLELRNRYGGQPEQQRSRLLLLALEREQVVAVAYREEAVAARVAGLDVDERVRDLIRQTLTWVWKDEQLHSEFMRGLLLEAGGAAGVIPKLVVYGRQLQGVLAGWTTAAASHSRARSTPLRAGAAGALVAVAGALGRMPPELARELHYQSFRRYCDLNVALETSAEYAYRHLVEVARSADERREFERIRDDEQRHTEAFRLLSSVLTEQDQLAEGVEPAELARQLGQLSPWFIPATQRAVQPRTFGAGGAVAVRTGTAGSDKLALLEECLDRAGLAEQAASARTAVIRVSFMLGYHRDDRSNINDPELVAGVAAYLRRHGVLDVAVLESPTVYGTLFAHRSVAEVAAYFGFDSSDYRIVDISEDLRPHVFDRGFVQEAISATWSDSDLRIVMPKLRTDPTEFAHLCLSTLEGSTGPIDDTFYAERQVDFRSATMMLLDVAPPDFAIVDGWAPVADGPFGVMASHRPAPVRCLYAGTDALAVDEAVLADLGVADGRKAPIVARAYHWFGLARMPVMVEGERPDLAHQLHGAHSSPVLRALGMVGYPVYVYLSRRGEIFVPEMDTVAFPPLHQPGPAVRLIRWASQRAFGLRPPPADA
jgi:uncharacterized protein (DUF362 family)